MSCRGGVSVSRLQYCCSFFYTEAYCDEVVGKFKSTDKSMAITPVPILIHPASKKPEQTIASPSTELLGASSGTTGGMTATQSSSAAIATGTGSGSGGLHKPTKGKSSRQLILNLRKSMIVEDCEDAQTPPTRRGNNQRRREREEPQHLTRYERLLNNRNSSAVLLPDMMMLPNGNEDVTLYPTAVKQRKDTFFVSPDPRGSRTSDWYSS